MTHPRRRLSYEPIALIILGAMLASFVADGVSSVSEAIALFCVVGVAMPALFWAFLLALDRLYKYRERRLKELYSPHRNPAG